MFSLSGKKVLLSGAGGFFGTYFTRALLEAGAVVIATDLNPIQDKNLLDSLFRGHLDNINRLASNGKLIVAGPFERNDRNYRGIFIFNVKTAEEAWALLKTDPTIEAKVLEAEVFSWYGSAALPMYMQFHEKVARKKI